MRRSISGPTPPASRRPGRDSARRPWQAWAALVAERARVAGRLEEVTRIYREQVASEEPRLQHAKLDALAEFAAGAGHELNNPLAVIVGRAQLLLVRETDPAAVRSLRAILTQAQRAHRILRDLMYVARTPEPRPRFCQFEEIVRNCLRDFRDVAEERGVRLLAEVRGPDAKVLGRSRALRHLTEILLRNALEATPKGGTVQLTTATSTTGAADSLTWIVQDNGRGIGPLRGCISLTRSTAAGKPAVGSASACLAPTGSYRRPAGQSLEFDPRPGDDLSRPAAPDGPSTPPLGPPRACSLGRVADRTRRRGRKNRRVRHAERPLVSGRPVETANPATLVPRGEICHDRQGCHERIHHVRVHEPFRPSFFSTSRCDLGHPCDPFLPKDAQPLPNP